MIATTPLQSSSSSLSAKKETLPNPVILSCHSSTVYSTGYCCLGATTPCSATIQHHLAPCHFSVGGERLRSQVHRENTQHPLPAHLTHTFLSTPPRNRCIEQKKLTHSIQRIEIIKEIQAVKRLSCAPSLPARKKNQLFPIVSFQYHHRHRRRRHQCRRHRGFRVRTLTKI